MVQNMFVCCPGNTVQHGHIQQSYNIQHHKAFICPYEICLLFGNVDVSSSFTPTVSCVGR